MLGKQFICTVYRLERDDFQLWVSKFGKRYCEQFWIAHTGQPAAHESSISLTCSSSPWLLFSQQFNSVVVLLEPPRADAVNLKSHFSPPSTQF